MTGDDRLDSVLADATWLTHRYDAERDQFQMRHLTREQHDAATFITDEYLGVAEDIVAIDRTNAVASIGHDNDLHFIIHSAFCASTMFARAFNLPGVSMGLKEPVLLNDIVGWRRRGAHRAQVAERLDHALHMLARPFGSDKAVIVKPSNVFNSLVPLALAMRQQSKAVLLYAPLPVFLVSVARKGLWCRLWCRELLEGLITDGAVDLGFEARDYFRQSDLQVAAVGWLAQHQLFHKIAGQFGPDRVATLDSEQLTGKPIERVAAAARHFGLDISEAQLINHPAFGTHSKFGGSFRTDDRLAEHAAARSAYGEEIEMVLHWAEQVAKTAEISMELPFALR
ncbi:MAG: hypothetical protein WBO17_13995 [Sphingorhabdus sp.]